MFDLIKQSVFAAVGLASLARDKAEELAEEVSRRAKLSESEANEFRQEFMKRRDAAQKDLQSEIDRRIDHAFIQMGIVKANVVKAGEESTREVGNFIDRQISEALERAGVARTEDLKSLTERVERLEALLSQSKPNP
jgi:polyhydroxyalkanoate synthesis regulator phasin